MNMVLKIFLSMSCSGGLLILVLLLGKRFLKNKLSRQWQYYIWLVVILRLLLPFGPETTLLGETYQAAGQAIAQTGSFLPPLNPLGDGPAPAAGPEQGEVGEDRPAGDLAAARPLRDVGALLGSHIWLVWLAAALGLLIRRITIYQGFMRYLKAGLIPVSDVELLDRLSAAAERLGVRRPVELCVNPLVSSPLLVGFFHPCIVLPGTDISEKNFQYTILHELTHCKRRDLVYKWLVQVTVCLHWFNPLVHLMGREIARACEFSCDEAVLAGIGEGGAQEYGKTLLDAMAAVGKYRENFGAVTLSENKRLLKERLKAIMNFRRRSTAIRLLTGALTLCVVLGTALVGVYPAAAAGRPSDEPPASGDGDSARKKEAARDGRYASLAEKYYAADSLPLFQAAFSRLDGAAQGEWMDRIYADRNIAFMGAAVNLLDGDCAQIRRLAEAAYEDGDAACFSTLAMHMSGETLEAWLDRALEDGKWAFQSVLFNALERDDEFDKLEEKREEEWAEAQRAEYGAVGVVAEGKDYYYRGQLVNVFLDVRPNKSFYTLNMNPAGTVNIRIVRNGANEITGAVYMTGAEAAELLDDMDGPEDDWEYASIPIDLKTAAAGETVFLGEYGLSAGTKIRYDVSAQTGSRMRIFFAGDGQKNAAFWSVNSLRQPGEPLKCTADFTVEPPAKPGTYRLYLQAPDGALGNITGSISIARKDA